MGLEVGVAAAAHRAWRSGWQCRSQSCLRPLCRLNLKVPSSEPSRSLAFSAPTSLLSSTSSMSLIRSTSLPVPCPSVTLLGRWRRGLDLQVHQHVPIRGEENRCPNQPTRAILTSVLQIVYGAAPCPSTTPSAQQRGGPDLRVHQPVPVHGEENWHYHCNCNCYCNVLELDSGEIVNSK
jgi:hypothetical protein